MRRLSRSSMRPARPSTSKITPKAFRRLLIEKFEARQLLAADMLHEATAAEPSGHQHNHSAEVGLESLPSGLVPTTHLVESGGFLTEPSGEDPLTIVQGFLQDNAAELGLTQADLSDFVVADRYQSQHTGVTHLYLQQRYNGLPIANARINANVAADGQIVNVGSSFVPLAPAAPTALAGVATGDQSDQPEWVGVESQVRLDAEAALQALVERFQWQADEQPRVVAQEAAPANRGQKQMLSDSGLSLDAIPAELQYVAVPYGVELAWQLTVRRPDGQNWYNAHVSSSTGELLALADWVSHASYNVFALPKESPTDGARTVEVDPHDPTASPFGWHDTNGVAGAEFTITRGNNAWAYADRDGNDLPDAGSSPDGGAALVFNSPINFAQQPLNYRDAAVTNLFYVTNAFHDLTYQLGFDEAAGNFQQNNYGNGGAAGDAILAEAQDQADGGPFGPLRGNANFSSPPDGIPGRMQIFLFDNTTPHRDASLDNGLVLHELTHGLTTRLTSGPGNSGALNTAQSAGMGEGWSDWFGLMLTQVPGDAALDARGVGTYLLGQPADGAGGRSLPYTYNMNVNNLTYGEIWAATSIHDIGEVWASVLWDLNWALIDGAALDPNLSNTGLGFDPDFAGGNGGNNLAMQLVVDALKLQPTTPSFLDARDAILAADLVLTGGVNQSTIWTVFARRGMGYSADDSGSSNSTFVIEAFDVPATEDGIVQIENVALDEGGLLNIVLRDTDLSGSQTVQVSSSGGDVETVMVDPNGPLGVFLGTVDTGAGPNAADGVLQVTGGDTITVSYVDASDGNGGSNVTKTDTLTVDTRMAASLAPGLPKGSLLSSSRNLAVLRSAADVEPFTFFAEAGEQIGVTAIPFDSALLDVQIVGVGGPVQSPAAGAAATLPLTTIPTTGLYRLHVGADAAVTGEVVLSRNSVDEIAVGDTAGGNELAIDSSAMSLAGGTRYGVTAQSVPVGPGIINGGFETGDFTGWEVIAIGNALAPWAVDGAGAGTGFGLAPTQPQSGSFAAWNGFEGAGPMEYAMSQNVLLPSSPVSLTWKDRIQWDFAFVPDIATEGRTFEVQVRDPETQTVLATLHSFDTQPEFVNATGDTGWQTRTADLSAFAGQYVQLAFIEHVPQVLTGPAQFEIDDISLVGMPAAAPDIDEFTVDLTGKTGSRIDVVLASEDPLLATANVELLDVDGSTVLATASSTPIDPGTAVRNYGSGILDFTVPHDGVFTLRVTAAEYGEYQLLVTESLAFDTEQNDTQQIGLLRSLDDVSGALGALDGENSYEAVPAIFDYFELPLIGSLYVFLGDDQVSDARALEFDFDFYDQTHDSVYVSSNGFLTFLPGQSDGCCFGQSLPTPSNPNAVIAGWWRDLAPHLSTEDFIRHRTYGEAGERIFYLEFKDVPHFSDPTLLVTMQFKLFEATGDIEVHYVKAPADGRDHSAGIENHTGTEGVEHYFGLDSLPENSAVRYQRASAIDRYTLTLAAGQAVTLQTQTPLDDAGHPVVNSLNPELRVLHPDGVTVVGADQDSLDGKNAGLTITAPVAGVYTVEVLATAGIGDYTLQRIPVDQRGPQIADVIVGSTDWADGFIDLVDGGAVGSGNGLGVSLAGADQLDNLGWVNLDRIYIQFSEDVSAHFTASNVQLTGINTADYGPGMTLAYGEDGENVGTIALASPLAFDVLQLGVSDAVQDSAGNRLDGEWVSGQSAASGNGTNGGAFNFRIEALPGDVNNSGGVNFSDVFDALNNSGALTNTIPLSRLDVNGNGGINMTDVFAIYNLNGTILPTPPPPGSILGGEGEGPGNGPSFVAGNGLPPFSTVEGRGNPVLDRKFAGEQALRDSVTDSALESFDYTDYDDFSALSRRQSPDSDQSLHAKPRNRSQFTAALQLDVVTEIGEKLLDEQQD